jgi:hypothetical protein
VSQTKAQRVSEFIQRIAREEITRMAGELVTSSPAEAQALMRKCQAIAVRVAGEIAHDRYRLQQLFDIVAYKQPPTIEGKGMKRGGR